MQAPTACLRYPTHCSDSSAPSSRTRSAMTDPQPETDVYIRLAHADDDDFILSLANRFADFELPPWRKRAETLAGIRRDIEHHLRTLPPASHLFVAEDVDARPLGFLHLQTRKDFFTGSLNCHISDLVVAAEHERRGVASAMLRYAEEWAKEHR